MIDAVRRRVQQFLGTDHLTEQEAIMARINDALNSLIEQQQEATAAQFASFSNLQSAVDKLRASAAAGDLSEADQKAVDQLTSGFDTMIATAKTADDDVEEPTPASVEDIPAVPAGDETTPPVTDGTTER